jgi:Ca2+-binding RTX toxin-like protein
MRALRILAAGIGALAVLGLPDSALAGVVVRDASSITYNADPATGSGERVDVGIENGLAFVSSERGVTSSSPGCTEPDPNRVECPITPAFIVNLLGFDDSLSGSQVTGPQTLEAHGRGGDDTIDGTQNADRLFGDEGGDRLVGTGGNDLLMGGPGDDSFDDGPGDDSLSGGPNNDGFVVGTGRDDISGGDGQDTADFRDRTGGVTITLNDQADDGEPGEGDNVRSDVESATGGSGNDRIVAGPSSSYLFGGAGNDSITGGAGEQRIEGNEGDDTIDTRDGAYDSIDCGPGNDVVLADPGDSTTGCEVAPDRDGDGTLNEADCAPDDAAVHPGAGEIFGNSVDEDCSGSPGYFKVTSGITFRFATKKRPPRVRITSLRLTALRAGDRIEIRCTGRRKGCPFRLVRRTARAGRPNVNLASVFKKRLLRRGAGVEVRILRANYIGKVVRFKVTKRPNINQTPLCLGVGATTPGRCPAEG